MCRFASAIYQPRTLEVRVWDLNSHSATLDALGLKDDNAPAAWREMHYLPDGTVTCAALDSDPVTAPQARAAILARWPSFAEFAVWACARAVHVDASGCAALTRIDAPVATRLSASGCAALTSIDAPVAKTLYASGCAALTRIDAPMAKTLDVTRCAALTRIDAPVAKTLYASGCAALTSIKVPVGCGMS